MAATSKVQVDAAAAEPPPSEGGAVSGIGRHPSRPYPAMRSARSPSQLPSGGVRSSRQANTTGPHVSTRTGTSPQSARSKSCRGTLSNRGAETSRPSVLYAQRWYGQRIVVPMSQSASASSVPR